MDGALEEMKKPQAQQPIQLNKTLPLSFRMDPAVKARLQELADEQHRSLTNYIEYVLEQHLRAIDSVRSRATSRR